LLSWVEVLVVAGVAGGVGAGVVLEFESGVDVGVVVEVG